MVCERDSSADPPPGSAIWEPGGVFGDGARGLWVVMGRTRGGAS